MFKKIFIFFWFFFVSSDLVFAGISTHCNETSSDNFIEKISSATPKYIEVTPNNNRKWQNVMLNRKGNGMKHKRNRWIW